MIEKLARIVAEELGDDFDDAHDGKSHWTQLRGDGVKSGKYRDINLPYKPDYADAVRAVLKALREPSMEMKLAAAPKITAQMPRVGPQADYDAAHDAWIAMMDALLADEGE